MCRENRIVLRVIMVVAIVCAASLVVAQTSDGETPANEGVCDDLKYATPGLYGLCVAFCEAQDCEPDLNAADPFEHCTPSSPKLVEIYNKKKVPGDPDMPCLQEPCPCWTEDELAGLRYPAAGDDLSCRKDYFGPGGILNQDMFRIYKPGAYNTYASTAEDYYKWDGPYCALGDTCNDGNCLGESRAFSITVDEWATCEAQLNQAGSDRGFDWTSCSIQ